MRLQTRPLGKTASRRSLVTRQSFRSRALASPPMPALMINPTVQATQCAPPFTKPDNASVVGRRETLARFRLAGFGLAEDPAIPQPQRKKSFVEARAGRSRKRLCVHISPDKGRLVHFLAVRRSSLRLSGRVFTTCVCTFLFFAE